MTEPERYLTTSEAAVILRVGPATVRRWIREGVLTATKVKASGSGKYLIARATVDAFDEAHR